MMSATPGSEIARFVVVQAPQIISDDAAKKSVAAVRPYVTFGGRTEFANKVYSATDRDELVGAAKTRRSQLDSAGSQRDNLLDNVADAILKADPVDAVLVALGGGQRADAMARLTRAAVEQADLLFASVLLEASPFAFAPMQRRLRAAEAARRILVGGTLAPSAVKRLLRARVVLVSPPDLVKPPVPAPAPEPQPDAEPEQPAMAERFEELNAARADLAGTARRLTAELRSSFRPRDATSRGGTRFAWRGGPTASPTMPSALGPWHNKVSADTASLLEERGFDTESGSIFDAIDVVDEQISQMRRAMAASPPSWMLAPRPYWFSKPGQWTNVPQSPSVDAAPTVPAQVGTLGSPRPGVLKLIRQELVRYELGEIAHIENVLKGESNNRTFSTSHTAELTFTETRQTTSWQEKDLQSTDRFELSSVTKQQIKDDLSLQSGMAISASYGPTVGVEIGTQFGYEHAEESSKESAAQFARELTSRVRNRIELQMTEQRVSRTVREVREITEHGVDNTAGADHVRGVYRWVNKVYAAQVVSYGMRTLVNLNVPEPAAFWLYSKQGKPQAGVTLPEPIPPTADAGDERPLAPTDLDEDNYTAYSGTYGAQDVVAPPPAKICISTVIEKGTSVKEEPYRFSSKVSTEITVPDGYVTEAMRTGIAEITLAGREPEIRFAIAGAKWGVLDDHVSFEGRTGTIPIGFVCNDLWVATATVEFKLVRTPEAFADWQLKTYDAIMKGYQQQRSAYEEQVKNAEAASFGGIQGSNPAANEKVIRDEVKKAAITILSAQRFDQFDSMRAAAGAFEYPEVALADADAEGRYAAFWEQAFEWENMTFLFYPYFWGKKRNWPVISQLDDADQLFAAFLKAGFARVQVPVRPEAQELVDYTFAAANWAGQQWVGADPPGFERESILTIDEEMLFQTGGADFVQRPGFVTLQNGSPTITGVETDFVDDDLNREIRVHNADYRIIKVTSGTQIDVDPSPSTDAAQQIYAIGPKLDGLPWEIVVPTSLVYLQAGDNLNP